ncbi:MAG: MATE family efflux transporter [Pseudomonadales bacterium]
MPSTESASKKGVYTEGSVTRHIFKISSIMILGFMAMTLGNLVELYYIGRIGMEALAAIAFMFPIIMALGAITRGIGIGAASLIAQAMSQTNHARTAELITHCYILVTLMTCSIALIGGFFSQAFLNFLGASGQVLTLSTQYSHIWFIGFPAMGLAMVSNGLIRAYGDPTFPGYIMTIAPLLQVVLGPFLIFGWAGAPALGLQGAAWAFVGGAGAQLALALYWYLLKQRLAHFSLVGFINNCRDILQVGIPAAATNLIAPVSLALITFLLSDFGDGVIAGFGVASRIESVVAMVVIGIATSVVPLVGQNWAAFEHERVHQSLTICYIACLLWGLTAAIIMWVGAGTFVHSINEDPSVLAVAVLYLHIVPISLGLMGVMTVATHGFNALRKPLPALFLSVARLLVIYLPLALLARSVYGYEGIFWATAFTNILLGIASAVWLNKMLRALQLERTAGVNETRGTNQPKPLNPW